MTRAYEWNGIGPKEECLLRLDWGPRIGVEWSHFVYQDDDLDQHEGYHSDSMQLTIRKIDNYATGSGFTITHYADLPTIARVVDLTERYRNDADEGATTV